MKTYSCIDCGVRMLRTAALGLFLIGQVLHPAFAEDKRPPDESKIHITADSLTADNNARFAEFTGNVHATQGTSVIQADRLKIHYRSANSQNGSGKAGAASIEKIIASGNVVITIDDKVAETRQAVYTLEDRVLVLSGKNSRITSGKDTITGETITFYRADGRIKVEGGGARQVEAVFFSGGKGLQ